MLEGNSFLLLRPRTNRAFDERVQIKDPRSRETTGEARELFNILERILRITCLTAVFPKQVAVLEKPDDSLVFTLKRIDSIHACIEVGDALGTPLGSFSGHYSAVKQGFTILDKRSNQFATVVRKPDSFDYSMMSLTGSELGETSRCWFKSDVTESSRSSATALRLDVSPSLAEQPLIKMLLLGAALTINLVCETDVNRAEIDLPR